MERPLVRLNKYLKRYWYMLVPGLTCAIISAGFKVTVPMVVRQAVDAIPRMVNTYQLFQGTAASTFLVGKFFSGLLGLGILILVLSLLSGAFLFLMRRTVVVASRHIEFDLRSELYDKLQQLSSDFYSQFSTGDVMTRASDDIEKVRRYVGPALMYATRALVIVLTAFSVMMYISPSLTMYALLPMPLLVISIFFVSKMMHTRSRLIQEQYSRLTSRVQEAFTGIRVLKAYTREEFELDQFEQESDEYKDRALSLALVDSLFRPAMLLLIGMSTVLVVWIGGRQVMAGEITIGNVAEYIMYVAIMTWPVASLGYVINMVQRASASSSRLFEILDTEPTITDSELTDWSIRDIEGGIAFEGVSFKYEDEAEYALKDVSFELPAGGVMGVVGRTGSGKSTLVRMIPRILDPDEGVVRIDGHDVRRIPLERLRQSVGYVPQDVFLFSDSTRNNITFGVDETDETELQQAAERAELYESIQDFPEGFETSVGERGITLSGGQKQRTAMARALIRHPRILVLDDALSAVDTETASAILEHLRSYQENRTVVMVSHRISTVQDADLIVVLDDGQVIERGTHRELIEEDGLYADLYRKQLLEQQIEAL